MPFPAAPPRLAQKTNTSSSLGISAAQSLAPVVCGHRVGIGIINIVENLTYTNLCGADARRTPAAVVAAPREHDEVRDRVQGRVVPDVDERPP